MDAVVLFGPWSEIHLSVVVAVAVVAGAWTGAWLGHGTRPTTGDLLAFGGALLAVLVALNGPLHELSDHYLFSAHMVQHLVLTLAVPPLLLAGVPGWMMDGLVRTVRAERLVRRLTRPVPALGLYTVALVGWHLPGPYGLALSVHGWHIVEHLALMGTATLAWWPVIARSTAAPRLPYAAQILYLFVFGLPMTAVAAMITVAGTVLYPFYAAAPRLLDISPLADQRLGGVIMWVPAGIIPLAAFTAVFFRWAAAERDEDVPVVARSR